MFAYTLEPMIIGFYLITAACLLSSSTAVRAVGLLLPLLSRYSLVLWMPLYLAIVALRESRRRAFALAGLVAVGVIALYVVPFFARDPSIFLRGQDYYVTAAVGEWTTYEGVPEWKPHDGFGVALYVYSFMDGTIEERVQVMRLVHLVGSAVAVLALAAWHAVARPRIDPRVFAVISLKVAVGAFYLFVQVPYAYLISLSLFLSVFVLLFVSVAPRHADSISQSLTPADG